MSSLSGLGSAAFVDDDSKTVVRFDRAHEDTSATVREALESSSSDTRGGSWFAGYTSEVEWMQPDLSSVSQMEAWMTNNTPVQFVAVGPEKIVQWYEPSVPDTFQSITSTVEDVDPLHGRLTFQGGDGTDESGSVVGYPNGSHRIYASRNALYPLAYDAGNSLIDTDNDGVPDGYTSSNFTSQAVNNGVYEAFASGSLDNARLDGTILMPIPDLTWTLSFDVLQLHDGGNTVIELREEDATGSVNQSASANLSTTGRASVNLTTSASAYSLKGSIIVDALSQNTKLKITKPALRVDGGTSYVTR